MRVIDTAIADVKLIEPVVHGDARGFFFESFNQRQFDAAIGRQVAFVQDNHSRSARGVLRGLHYQLQQPQGKLVRVLQGAIFDVVVDLRRSSSSFGHWLGHELSADNRLQLWLPEGFAHGFVVLGEYAEVLYKTSDYYAPQYERCIRWDDPDLAIKWPLDVPPVLSTRDAQGTALRAAELFT